MLWCPRADNLITSGIIKLVVMYCHIPLKRAVAIICTYIEFIGFSSNLGDRKVFVQSCRWHKN